MAPLPKKCPLCLAADFEPIHHYAEPPSGETRFPLTEAYRRDLYRCRGCGHFFSATPIDLQRLYEQDYVSATYDGQGLRAAFERITGLPADRSDNAGRLRAVDTFATAWMASERVSGGRRLLDVGSGLCVFAYGMRRLGWECTALDPDERAARHAREVAQVEAVHADFVRWRPTGQPFALVSFNKVLEHVVDPIAMLAHARECLVRRGLVYAELPDGEAAIAEGPGREEFFIEHHHAFSLRSIALLAERAGFQTLQTERLREPSRKFTLRAFLTPR